MRNLLIVLGLLKMVLITENSFGSALLDDKENQQIRQSIAQKITPNNIDVSALTGEEKEWLYETELLETLSRFEKKPSTSTQDKSRILGDLAKFYNSKNRMDLAQKWYFQQADLDLRDALRGDEAVLGIFNNMLKNKILTDSFFSEIIAKYSQDQDKFAQGAYESLTQVENFQNHVLALATAYEKSDDHLFKVKKLKLEPLITISDRALAIDFQDRFHREGIISQ